MYKRKASKQKTGTNKKKAKRVIAQSTVIPAAMPMFQKFFFKFEDTITSTLALAGEPLKAAEFQVNNLNALDVIPPSAGQSTFPSGYSNWSRFYNNFLVNYVKINVEFINSSTEPIYAVIAFKPIIAETWATWAAWRNLDSNSFPNKQVLLTARGGAKDSCKLSVGCNLGKLTGKPDAWNALDAYSGKTNGNNPQPVIQQLAYVAALSGTGANISANVSVKITIDVIATLYQLRTQFNGSSN